LAGKPLSRDAMRRAKRRGNRTTEPFQSGRDPKPLKDVLERSVEDLGWSYELSQAQLVASWSELVGSGVAAHTEVVAIRDGVIQVQCDSTAWTTELRRLRGHIVTKINEKYPSAKITDVRVYAPGAPSWRHGPRRIPGRGPRDTYG
jgi:predicted nucleic acid-binding Zn ribbon protein